MTDYIDEIQSEARRLAYGIDPLDPRHWRGREAERAAFAADLRLAEARLGRALTGDELFTLAGLGLAELFGEAPPCPPQERAPRGNAPVRGMTGRKSFVRRKTPPADISRNDGAVRGVDGQKTLFEEE